MGPAKSIGICFVRFSEFSGRSTRPEYWWIFDFAAIGFFAALFVNATLLGPYPIGEPMIRPSIGSGFIVVTILTILEIGYWRLLDIDFPVWIYVALAAAAYCQIAEPNQVAMTVSIFASISTIILCARKSHPAPNRFGPNSNEVNT